jgi:sec-independent protein translocase protein TatA
MGSLSPLHWLIVVGVVVLLFSAKRLPDMARSVGQSARVLRGELQGLREDATPAPTTAPTTAPTPTTAPAPAPAPARQETAGPATPATGTTQRAETSAERAGAGEAG